MMIQKEKLLMELQEIAYKGSRENRAVAKALFYIIKKVDRRWKPR